MDCRSYVTIEFTVARYCNIDPLYPTLGTQTETIVLQITSGKYNLGQWSFKRRPRLGIYYCVLDLQ